MTEPNRHEEEKEAEKTGIFWNDDWSKLLETILQFKSSSVLFDV